MKGRLQPLSPAWLKARKQVRDLRSSEGLPVARRVELRLQNHRDENGIEKPGWGSLYREQVKTFEDLAEEEQGKLNDDEKAVMKKGVALYRHGDKDPIWFVAPLGMDFLEQIKYLRTTHGYRRFAFLASVILILIEIWQWYYLPQVYLIPNIWGDVVFSKFSIMVWTSIFWCFYMVYYFGKTANAFRVDLRCLHPEECERLSEDLHWGILASSDMSDSDQWEWWHHMKGVFPVVAEHMKGSTLKRLEDQKQLVDDMEIRLKATKVQAREDVIEELGYRGIITNDHPMMRTMKTAITGLAVLCAALLIISVVMALQNDSDEPEIKIIQSDDEENEEVILCPMTMFGNSARRTSTSPVPHPSGST